MPAKKGSRGKALKAKRTPGGAKRRVARAPKETYKDVERFLGKLRVWWSKLDADVSAVEKLARELRADQPLSPEVRRKLRVLTRRIERELTCPYPPHTVRLCLAP